MEPFPVDNKCREEKETKKKEDGLIDHGSHAWDPVGEIEPESRGWLTRKKKRGVISDNEIENEHLQD